MLRMSAETQQSPGKLSEDQLRRGHGAAALAVRTATVEDDCQLELSALHLEPVSCLTGMKRAGLVSVCTHSCLSAVSQAVA